jgi:chromosome partitioning protein
VDKYICASQISCSFCYNAFCFVVLFHFQFCPHLIFVMIISFASSKGGVGKSTSCAALGAALALDGEKVLILDLDQNRTLARWSKKVDIDGLEIIAVERDRFTAIFRNAVSAGKYDAILIDLAGAREATVLKAIARSDLVIIPAQASEPDLREALVVVSDIRDVEEEKEGSIPYRLLLTKIYPLRTRVTDFAYDELARHGLPTFRTALVERAAYREMFLNGVPPSKSQPGKGAGEEIDKLLAEIRAILAGEYAKGKPMRLEAAKGGAA